MNICVFGSSSEQIDKIYLESAEHLGKKIAEIVKDNYQSWIAIAEGYGFDMSYISSWMDKLDWDSMLTSLKEHSGEILSTAGQAANSVFGMVANILFGLIFAIYILLNKKKLGKQAKQLAYAYLKKPWADEACDIASLSYKTFSNFLSGYFFRSRSNCWSRLLLTPLLSAIIFKIFRMCHIHLQKYLYKMWTDF